jgi:L-lactate dehydrogenase complex protein LldG
MFDDSPPASLLSAFKESLISMGWVFLNLPASGDPSAPVRAKIADAKVVCSTVPEIVGNRDIAAVSNPRDVADADFAVVRASFGVAETGSVLLGDADLQVDAVAYLAQHLIVLLDPADVVVNLPHAYRRPEFWDGHYASFPRDRGYRRRVDPWSPGCAFTVSAADRKLGQQLRPLKQKANPHG